MNVVEFPGKPTRDEKQKEALVDVLRHLLDLAEKGEVLEFVGATIDNNGSSQIHVASLDLPGAIGLFEIGKHILILQDH